MNATVYTFARQMISTVCISHESAGECIDTRRRKRNGENRDGETEGAFFEKFMDFGPRSIFISSKR